MIRSLFSALLLTLAVIATPLSLMSAWGSTHLLDTAEFTNTLTPLAEEPAVQEYLTTEISTVVIDTIAEQTNELNLPSGDNDGLTAALRALAQNRATAQLTEIVEEYVGEFVASETFATAWSNSLSLSHRHVIAIASGRQDAGLTVTDDGILNVDGGALVASLRTYLEERDIAVAPYIPEVDYVIPVADIGSVAALETSYSLLSWSGAWLPFVTFLLVIGGTLLARWRLRALGITATCVAIVGAALWGVLVWGLPAVAEQLDAIRVPQNVVEAALPVVLDDAVLASLAVALVSATVAVLAFLAHHVTRRRKDGHMMAAE